ncbi:MAG: hypothetical protein Ct9H300mP16_10820 [Pseudomonadota bacterium]|nr:MAG: hypothetical protein Ct9H300mP16_10820 [Pseudomonadota bacterium]
MGQRGYEVMLAERARVFGGRVSRETTLPGLATWARVRDWRIGQISQMNNVTPYLESDMTAEEIVETDCGIVALATGAPGVEMASAETHRAVIPGAERSCVFTPDDILDGVEPEGPVVVFDDDHYYMGGVIAERVRALGREVVFGDARAGRFRFHPVHTRAVTDSGPPDGSRGSDCGLPCTD